MEQTSSFTRSATLALTLVAILSASPLRADDVVFCVDNTQLAASWDREGARTAAIGFADSLLSATTRRSLIIFSRQATLAAAHEATPFAQRPGDEANAWRAAFDTPASSLPSPLAPLELALDVIESQPRSDAPKAIVLIMGYYAHRGRTTTRQEQLAALAMRGALRCQLLDARLFVVHRDSDQTAPGMSALWSEMTALTGGQATYAETPAEMTRAVARAAQIISGLFAATPDASQKINTRAGQEFLCAFELRNESPEAARQRFDDADFRISPRDDLQATGGVAYGTIVANRKGQAYFPIDGERLIGLYTGFERRARVRVLPSIASQSVDAPSPLLVRVTIPSRASLPADAVARLIERGPQNAIVAQAPLGPTNEASTLAGNACDAYFDDSPPPGSYQIQITTKEESESLFAPLHVYTTCAAARLAPDPSQTEEAILALTCAQDDDALAETQLLAAYRIDNGPTGYHTLLSRDGRFAGQLVESYQSGQIATAAVGVIGVKDARLTFAPTDLLSFPPRMAPPAQTRPQTARRDTAEKDTSPLPAATNRKKRTRPTELAPTDAAPAVDTWGIVEWVIFTLANAILVGALALIWTVGRPRGLFTLRYNNLALTDAPLTQDREDNEEENNDDGDRRDKEEDKTIHVDAPPSHGQPSSEKRLDGEQEDLFKQ